MLLLEEAFGAARERGLAAVAAVHNGCYVALPRCRHGEQCHHCGRLVDSGSDVLGGQWQCGVEVLHTDRCRMVLSDCGSTAQPYREAVVGVLECDVDVELMDDP